MRTVPLILVVVFATLLSGCAVVRTTAAVTGSVVSTTAAVTGAVVSTTAAVTGAVVSTTAAVTGAVVSTTAVVAGAAVKGTARAVSSIGEDDEEAFEQALRARSSFIELDARSGFLICRIFLRRTAGRLCALF